MKNKVEKKHLDYQLSIEGVNENGIFKGYASVFDVMDNHMDVVVKGAFVNALAKNKDIKLLWQHKVDEPIGVFTDIREDEKGLYVEGQLLLDVQRANEAYALLKSGAIDGLSIGYTVKDYEIDDETGIRILKEVDLWEISLVTFPANSHASVVTVKSAPETVREFETFLRDAGFSRKSAKLIALNGFDSQKQRDAGDDEFLKLETALDRVVNILSN